MRWIFLITTFIFTTGIFSQAPVNYDRDLLEANPDLIQVFSERDVIDQARYNQQQTLYQEFYDIQPRQGAGRKVNRPQPRLSTANSFQSMSNTVHQRGEDDTLWDR